MDGDRSFNRTVGVGQTELVVRLKGEMDTVGHQKMKAFS